MSDVLIFGDTYSSPELRREVPIGIPDPFLYIERADARHVVIGAMEIPRLEEEGGYVLHSPEDYGKADLVASGATPQEIDDEILVRAVRAIGVEQAIVPDTFPLRQADLLRATGVGISADGAHFAERRRRKSASELAGIRRALAAAEAGMRAARDTLAGAGRSQSFLTVNGETLTVERLKALIAMAVAGHGASCDDLIVSRGPQTAIGHDMGSGCLREGEPIIVDLWPCDTSSGLHADLTRTFVVGVAPDYIVEWHAIVRTALQRTIEMAKSGMRVREIYERTCDFYEGAGYRTVRTADDGRGATVPRLRGLGHGIGFQVHEAPVLDIVSDKELVAGDVLAVEPGLYLDGVGGVRIEELVVIGERSAEVLTQFPHDLVL